RPRPAVAASGFAGGAGADAGALPGQVLGLHGEALPRAAAEAARLRAGLHGDEAGIARGGAGAPGSQAVGAPQEAPAASSQGPAAAPGRLAARLARGTAGARPDRGHGRGDDGGLLAVFGGGGRDGLDVPGLAGGGGGARAVLRALHRPRQPLLRDAEGRRQGVQDRADAGGTGVA